MKKIMTIALGLGLILGLTTATFAQDKATKAKTTKAKATKATKAAKSTAKM
jgi:hypothetical protein